jgi:peptidoglycan/LPS O-acetylase OafA/YrhL
VPPEHPAGSRNDALDAARFAAALGVILIHCGPTTAAAARVVDGFQDFAVPFFLLASLYLFWREVSAASRVGPALGRRAVRLLVPYLAWTAIYLTARIGKLALQGTPGRSLLEFESLLPILAAGQGAVQLYFLPYLFAGLCLSALLCRLLRTRAAGALLGGVLAVGIALLFAPPVPVGLATGAVSRLAWGYLEWGRLLLAPAALAGLIALTWRAEHASRGRAALLAVGFVGLGVGFLLVPVRPEFRGVILSALLLGACLHLGAFWRARPGVSRVTRTAFGVFLVHHLLIELLEWADAAALGAQLKPYTLATQALVGPGVLAASVGFVLGVRRCPWLARLLLGEGLRP